MDTCQVLEMPIRSQSAHWNALHADDVDSIEVRDSRASNFVTAELGSIAVARFRHGTSLLDRDWLRDVAGAEQSHRRSYVLLLQARGISTLAHYGHTAILREGDVILCNNAAPMSFDPKDSSEVVTLRIPSELLKEHLPSPDLFCGKLLQASDGLTGAITSLTLSLCSKLQSGLPQEFQNRVASHLLDLIATSYAMAFESITSSSSVVDGLYAKVKLYIEQHLRDPELSPCTIAEKLKLSSRYLRMVFATGEETASAYILRRRLEECARQIADPSWRGHSITQIAFAWGFNSAPHFSRSFRARYSMSPRHYRRAELEGFRARKI